jgi:protein ImuB
MLWIALHLPELALQVYLRGAAPANTRPPLAVVEGRRILAADAAAQALGVHPGLGIPTACALAPNLVLKPRSPVLEAAAIEEIALWAGQFTPQVSLDPPAGLLLEVAASLRLFSGLAALRSRLDQGLASLGFAALSAAAPTPLAARLLALAGHRESVTAAQLPAALAELPTALLELDAGTEETLAAIGARRLGDCLSLPRDGLARRCGPEPLRRLDRALGRLPDPRPRFEAPVRFAARIELDWPAETTEPLLFLARRLLASLAGFLAARHAGIDRFRLELEHEERPPTPLSIELASRGRDEARFLDVLRERLARLALEAPVRGLALAAEAIDELVPKSRSLFDEGRDSRESCARLLESLRARLGGEAVTGVRTVPAHRPEFAWEAAEPGEKQRVDTLCGQRPLWLLEPPQALPEQDALPQWNGPVLLLAGPERIESGWWDGADCARDYYLACGPDHELLWLFRERRSPHGWYLHGLFA